MDEDGVAKQKEKRKTSEDVHGCSDGGHIGVREEDAGNDGGRRSAVETR